jgi:hypothetical protein
MYGQESAKTTSKNREGMERDAEHNTLSEIKRLL